MRTREAAVLPDGVFFPSLPHEVVQALTPNHSCRKGYDTSCFYEKGKLRLMAPNATAQWVERNPQRFRRVTKVSPSNIELPLKNSHDTWGLYSWIFPETSHKPMEWSCHEHLLNERSQRNRVPACQAWNPLLGIGHYNPLASV